MKKLVLVLSIVFYVFSFVGCAEYKVSDIVDSVMTMNDNGQKEIKAQKK
jgi:hypothetical protein